MLCTYVFPAVEGRVWPCQHAVLAIDQHPPAADLLTEECTHISGPILLASTDPPSAAEAVTRRTAKSEDRRCGGMLLLTIYPGLSG